MSSGGLTDEQKRRIEENKRKALARRIEKTGSSTVKTNPTILAPPRGQNQNSFNQGRQQSVPAIPASTSNGNKPIQGPAQQSVGLGSSNHEQKKSFYHNKNIPSSKDGYTAKEVGKKVAITTSPNNNIFAFMGKNKPVKGKCLLVSRERFQVAVGFSQPLIEVFKSMKTKLYDAASKAWSFLLEDYECLMNAVRGMKPHVDIEPLPRAILQAFSSQLKGKYPESTIDDADLTKVDKKLVESLLPFQRTGVNFGVQKNGRVLIADDMGLGKTIQAICLAAYYREEWPLLVVVPSSVRFDWAQQIGRWLPSVDPQDIFVALTGKDSRADSLICILSYDLMAKKGLELKNRHYQVIIMDECHLLKNYKTARCRAAMPLLQNAHHVILLSGTPALSRPSELYTQVSAVCPFLFKFQDFGVRYCDGKKLPWGWDFSGSSNMAELQILLEEKIMIRRLKKDVLSQLPSKVRNMVMLDPGSIKMSKDMKNSSKVMNIGKLKGMERRGALLEYFHHTGTAKIPAIRDYIVDLLEGDRKFLIFAHHQEVLDAMEDIISAKLGKNYIRIDGKTTAEQRNYFCRKFQEQDSIRAAVLSITAANAGLNLSAATLVVFGELFWNPGILVQAEDRAHRIGQQDMVSVHYLVSQGTADDHIWPLVQKKLDVLNKAGLSKDDFSSADTKHVKNSNQTDLMMFFEESFMDDDAPIEERDTDVLSMSDADTAESHRLVATLTPKKGKQQSTLHSYFSPSKSKDNKINNLTETEALQTGSDVIPDDGDLDLLMDDVDWGEDVMEPENKRQKIL